jgi:protein phosphatase
VLQKALGAGHQFVDPQVGRVGYESGDIFLLCTDGLTDSLFNSRLEEILRSREPAENGRDPADILVRAALEFAARDNITALVVEVK